MRLDSSFPLRGRLFAKMATILPFSVSMPLCNVTLQLLSIKTESLFLHLSNLGQPVTCFGQENMVEMTLF